MTEKTPTCLYCHRSANEVPLISLVYRDGSAWICPQHLPILIHQPHKLANILPGVENLDGPEGHDH